MSLFDNIFKKADINTEVEKIKSIDGDDAVIKAGIGPLTKLDCGIVRYNFEAASGHKCRSI